MRQLRDYQKNGVDLISQSFRRGHRRVIACLATGGGKSALAMEIIRRTLANKKRALFLTDRNLLIDQFSREAKFWNLEHGLIRKGGFTDRMADFVIASKDTFTSIYLKRQRFDLPDYDLLVTDECHRSLSPTWAKVFEAYSNKHTIGLTATPIRPDGSSLAPVYTDLICPIQPSQLLHNGHLVPSRCYSPTFPNLRGVGRGADGDYSKKDLEKVMNRNNMVGDVVAWWKRLAEDRPTLTYGVTIKHSLAMRDNYLKEGIKAVHIDGKSDDNELLDAFAAFNDGKVKVICSADLCTEGVDLPLCSCIQIVRPTKSLRLAMQIYGRGMRPHELSGKMEMVVIDHAGVVLYNGFPGTDVPWSIEAEHNIQKQREKDKAEGKQPTPILCPKCFLMYQGLPACPQCGHKPMPKGKDIKMKAGTLMEVERGEAFAPDAKPDYDRIWMRCLATAANRGHSFSTAAAIFKSQTNKMPWEANVTPLAPELPPEQQDDPDKIKRNWKASVLDEYPKFRRAAI